MDFRQFRVGMAQKDGHFWEEKVKSKERTAGAGAARLWAWRGGGMAGGVYGRQGVWRGDMAGRVYGRQGGMAGRGHGRWGMASRGYGRWGSRQGRGHGRRAWQEGAWQAGAVGEPETDRGAARCMRLGISVLHRDADMLT